MKVKRSHLYFIFVAIVIGSLAARPIINMAWTDLRLVNEPIHSAVEAAGAIIAIFMSFLLLQKRGTEYSGKLFLVAMGLLGMGIFDGFHAISTPGKGFVLLHSMGSLSGSIWFSLIWLPGFAMGKKSDWKRSITWLVAGSAVLLSIWIMTYRETLPIMIQQGRFTNTAIAVHLLAGVFFVVSTVRFMIDFHRSESLLIFLFACMSILFGVAALTFSISAPWNATWWLWHALRLISYFVLSGFVFYELKWVEEDLKKARDRLEQRVDERTYELGIANEELEHEIGERVRMEETLKEKNSMLQTLIHAIPDMVFFKDSGGRFLLGNKIMEESIGLRQEEFVGKSDDELSPPDVAEACKRSDAEAINKGGPTRSEESYTDKNGDPRYLDVVKSPIYDTNGDLLGLVGVGRDITERKLMEATLRQSEEKFRTLFESAIDALFIIDMDGNFIDVNKTAYERLGYTKAEMFSMNISQLDHPDFADKIPERMEHLQKHGWCMCESAHLRKDGTAMPVEVNARLMEFQGRKVFFSAIRDISERKLMEEALLESEKRYHTLFEQSPDGILLIDTAGKIIEFNETAHRQLGYSREEFAKLSVSDIDPVESPEEIQDRINRLLKEGKVEFDVKHSTKQGEIRDVQIITQPIDLSGKTFSYAIWRDITERKRMEHALQESKEKFESLAEGSPLGIALIDMNDNILYINTKLESFFGYTLGSTPNLKTWWAKAYPDETVREQIISQWQNTVLRIQRGEKSSPLNRKVACDDGTVKDIEIRVSILGENIIAVFDDITERKQLEEHLKKTIMERETLLRELYHRTKNNMNTISSLINLQTAYLHGDEIAIQMFRDLQDRIMSMALVHERLYKSKDLSNVNLKDYVSDLANTLMTGYKINRDKLSLILDIEDFTLSIDTLIPCGLIINELMTNSLKYAFVDGREGQISIKGQVSSEREIQLVYRDNGIGFSEGFDFAKVETLGLRLINGLITSQLRGKIEITTRPETVFTFAFLEPGYQQRI
jgi:PAS domain S-box-containing protein